MPNDNGAAVIDLLILALGPIGAGKVVQELVNALVEAAPQKLTSNQKFYLAILVSFVVPIAAYGLLVWLGAMDFDLATLLWEIGIGYMVSQQFHRTAEQQAKSRRPVVAPLTLVPGDNSTPAGTTTGELTGPATLAAPQTLPLDPVEQPGEQKEAP
jgi:hypothetical protein